jgi:heterotetrameric sarcosine oxidase gamma subunit
MLETTSKVAFVSPLSNVLKDLQAVSLAAFDGTVGLEDFSGQPIWLVRGNQAGSMLGADPLAVGNVLTFRSGLIARPRGDQYFLLNVEPEIQSSTEDNSTLTVTDLTHGYGHLLLLGKQAVSVLAKVCGLDFSDKAFPNNHIAQTSLAKVRTTIIRHDRDQYPAYHILVGYPVTVYVWEVLFDAMNEFDGKYVTRQL